MHAIDLCIINNMAAFIAFIFFIVGIGILLKGADWLVAGASSIATIFKINPMVIGLTVVAFGTSAPELVVSITSALAGNTDVTLGNIIGSNIANILLILGVTAIIYPLSVKKNTIWKEIPMSFLGACLLVVLALQEIIDNEKYASIYQNGNEIIGVLTRSNGIVLLFFFIIFLYYTFGISKIDFEDGEFIQKKKFSVSILLLILGMSGLVLGSNLMVDNGVKLAKIFGVSDALIGLTLVAIGTSLPELVTSVVAALKKRVDIAVGNVVGSNIFNIFFVLGMTTLIKPIPLAANYIVDIAVLFGATILLFGSLFVMRKQVLGKTEGAIMLIVYFSYLGFLIVRG